MSRPMLLASLALSFASLAVAGWALMENAALREEAAAAKPRADSAAPADAARIEGIEDRLRRLEAVVIGLPGGGPPLPGEAPPAAHAGAADADADPARREPLRALLRDLLREEREAEAAAGKGDGAKPADGGGERKPPLSQFAAELDLEPAQRETVHRAVLQGQEGMIALLRTPTAGGRVPMDDLLSVLLGKPEEAQPRMIELFGMLASEKVPGSEGTYAERAEALKREAVETFRREFTAEQFKAFERTGQDPLEIQVPDSPWIGILQEAWRRTK